MKKIATLLSILVGSVMSLQAQYYHIPYPNANTNPGSINNDAEYPSGGGLPAGWVTFGNPSAAPAWSANQSIPFAFNFNGAAATSYKVSNSGVLTFDVATALAAPSFTRAALPNAAIPDKSVCIWGLGGIGSNDYIISKTFGTAPNRQHWIQFSSYGYGTTASDGSNFCYWSIVLEETSNRIYVVDNRSGGYSGTNKVSIGVQINSGSAVSVAGSPDVTALATTDPTPADNTYYTFIYGTQPAYDLACTQITTNPYLVAGNVNVAGTLRNLGSTTITSLTMNYKIDGGAAVSSVISGLNITPLGTYNFTHPTPWNATIGSHTVECYATLLNGSNPDANPADDSKIKSVSVMSELVQRLPLYEIFSSSTCGPCKPGNENFAAIVAPKPKSDYVKVKFQQDFPGTGDPYCTTEAVNRRGYYAINSIPRMEIDGGWDGNASSFTSALYDASRAVPANYKLTGEYNVVNKTITAKARFSPLFNAAGAKLYVAVLENKTVNNVKSNGEVEFHDVMKKMIPNETGTSLPNVSIGNWDSLSFSYTFNGNYKLPTDGSAANRINHASEHSIEEFTDLYVIAWIQGADKQVYQAANLTSLTPVGTNDLSNAIQTVNVYPNPASEFFQVDINMQMGENVLATLVDANGRVIESRRLQTQVGNNTMRFETSSLANGIYHLMIFDSKKNASVHEVLVRH
ncbi:MAG: T9SS type A sorting domain-containing protein [Chitinophagaceae bacterium]